MAWTEEQLQAAFNSSQSAAPAWSEDQLRATWEASRQPTWQSESRGITAGLGRGITGLAGLATDINPVGMVINRGIDLYNNLQGNEPKGFLQQLLPSAERYNNAVESVAPGFKDTHAISPMGRIAETVAEYLPGAVVGGEGAITQMALSGAGAGVARQVAPGNPWAELAAAVMAPSGVKTLGKVAETVPQLPAKVADAVASGAERNIFGLKLSDVYKADRKAPTMYDAAGNITKDPNLAVEIVPAHKAAIQDILSRKIGVSDSAKVTADALSGDLGNLSKQQAAIAAAADASGATVSPDFSQAQKFIDKYKTGNAKGVAKELQTVLDEHVDRLTDPNLAAMTFTDGLTAKQVAGDLGKYAKGTIPTPQQQLHRMIERAYAKALENAAPDAKAWQGINRSIASNLTLLEPTSKKAAQGLLSPLMQSWPAKVLMQGAGMAVGVPEYSMIADAILTGAQYTPKLTASIARPVEKVLTSIGKGLGKPGELIASIPIDPKMTAIAALLGGQRAAQSGIEAINSAHPTTVPGIPPIDNATTETIGSTTKNANAALNPSDSATLSSAILSPGMDALLKAVAKIESNNTTNAVSKAGAKGKFQLMDATGAEYHKRLGLSGKYDPFNDAQAEKIAAAYLKDMLKKYGDESLALAAYNMGETQLDRLLRKYKGNKAKALAHYGETAAYVPKVLEALNG